MNMERNALIIYLTGFIDHAKQNLSRMDKKILLDQQLIKMNQPPMTREELLIYKELADEIDITMTLMGINRKEGRELSKQVHVKK